MDFHLQKQYPAKTSGGGTPGGRIPGDCEDCDTSNPGPGCPNYVPPSYLPKPGEPGYRPIPPCQGENGGN